MDTKLAEKKLRTTNELKELTIRSKKLKREIVDLCKQLEKQVLKDQENDELVDKELVDDERTTSFTIEKDNF